MKLKAFLFAAAIFTVGALIAGDNSWLSKVGNTVDNVNSIVSGEGSITKTTIKDVKTSGSKYVNKKVEVSGKIVGLAVGSGEGKFVVIIADEDGTKMNVNVTNNPYRRLLDSATAVGTYNGDSLDNGKII
ncbi:MAG: hypothetical protein WCR55_08320 [Lentisphaerota bacterium]